MIDKLISFENDEGKSYYLIYEYLECRKSAISSENNVYAFKAYSLNEKINIKFLIYDNEIKSLVSDLCYVVPGFNIKIIE